MPDAWTALPPDSVVNKVADVIRGRGIDVIIVKDKAEALKAVQKLIPKGAEVMNGSSTTLAEIGYMQLLESGKHPWKDVHKAISSESDDVKRNELRRKSVTAEYFLGSVNAIVETGELVACDMSGSRVGAYLFAAKNLVLVSGTQKIVPSLEKGMQRVREYVLPLEDARMKKLYGMGSKTGKWMMLEHERPGRTTLILIKERLGF